MREALVEFTPADTGARSSFLTYEPYYGLKEKAFSLSADPRFLYKSRAHAPMFDELRAGIRRREGIIVLTGEPGTGKTTLCRSVLAAHHFEPIPTLERLLELDRWAQFEGSYRSQNKTLRTKPAGRFVVVVFDQGEPGVGDPVITGDGFSIELTGLGAPYAGYTRAGYIEGGNIQVDK